MLVVDRRKRRKLILDHAEALTTAQTQHAKEISVLQHHRDTLQKQLNEEKHYLEEAHTTLNAFKEKYGSVIDAESYAVEIRLNANDELQAAQTQIATIRNEILENQRALKAIKNKIEGYGDEYILPTQSLLDDLAEAFGFDDAGKALKEARAHTTKLIKSGAAAVCDYVEENRRVSAINFVIDAFNGKVDSLQARIKADNAGTLMQKVEDAFATVNNYGKAFRNARITPEYLAAREAEVKWGAVVQALKERARDEQRAIKEQMREEERARREYEKALKEAAKEEEKAKLALEKAQIAYAKAQTESERQKLEERMAEFQAQLNRVHEKTTQAVSMAQLTRSGHVYIISNIGSFGENVLKIGMTRRLEPMERVKELGDASVPFPFDVHGMIYSEDAVALENELHSRFTQKRVNKVNFRKEFFQVSLDEIRQVASELGIEVQFTILAAALEFRETLAIEHLPETEQLNILEHSVKSWERNPLQRLLEDEEEAVMAN